MYALKICALFSVLTMMSMVVEGATMSSSKCIFHFKCLKRLSLDGKYRIYKITYFDKRACNYLQRDAGIDVFGSQTCWEQESQTTIFAASVVGAKQPPECSALVAVFTMGKGASKKKNMVTFLMVPNHLLYCRRIPKTRW